MAVHKMYNPRDKGEVFNALRHQILAARLQVTLDKRQNRKTSATVKRLAELELPPSVESANNSIADPVAAKVPAVQQQIATY